MDVRHRRRHAGATTTARRSPARMPELLAAATDSTLDLRDLVRALERVVPEGTVVRAAPGLLAADRSAAGAPVLEGARRRGATVVVVAPGGPDLANHAGLTVAAAREAGLAVPAVVVVGPGGQAERERLAALADVPLVALADLRAPSADVVGWPVAGWLLSEPARATGQGVALSPYGAWEPRAVPDPRTAGRDAVDPVLLEVVGAEGPVLAARAFGLINRAAGGKKLTSIARAPLSSSAYRLRQQGRLELVGAAEPPGQGDEVLRLAGAPRVRVRELGPRALDEVPLDELAELLRRLRAAGAEPAGGGLRRAALDAYGLTRMTTRADELLGRAEAVADELRAGGADAAAGELGAGDAVAGEPADAGAGATP